MKNFIYFLSLLPTILVNGQTIDWKHFSEKKMDEIMFNKMNIYAEDKGGYSLIHSTVLQKRIYNYIKKNSNKMSIDSLSSKINSEILIKYNSKSSASVGIINGISSDGIKTYQEIADICILDWKNSPSDSFFMIGWGKVGGVTTFFNNKNKVIYILFVFSNLSEYSSFWISLTLN